MGLSLPAPPAPAGSYVPCVRAGTLVYVSGMLPRRGGAIVMGRAGEDMTVEEAREAARLALLSALAALKAEIGGLERVARVVRLTGYVRSGEGFADQHKVIDGASALLGEVFGDRGLHSRVSVGVSHLPLNAVVELDLVVEVL